MTDRTIDPDAAVGLESAIAAAGGKQADLARALECAQQTVSKLVTGEIRMTADWALRIERATGIDAGRLYPPLARRAAVPERVAP